MAVDTAEKRFSMLNFGDGTNVHLMFEPDGAVDLDDRQHLLDCYSGIAFAAAVVAEPEAKVIVVASLGGGGGTFLLPPETLRRRQPVELKAAVHLTAVTSASASAVIVKRAPVVTAVGARLDTSLVVSVRPLMIHVLSVNAPLRASQIMPRDRVRIVAGPVRFHGRVEARAHGVVLYEGEDLWLLGLTLDTGAPTNRTLS